MRRLIILTLALLLLAPPGEAFAHAFGRTYHLPVPFWLYRACLTCSTSCPISTPSHLSPSSSPRRVRSAWVTVT